MESGALFLNLIHLHHIMQATWQKVAEQTLMSWFLGKRYTEHVVVFPHCLNGMAIRPRRLKCTEAAKTWCLEAELVPTDERKATDICQQHDRVTKMLGSPVTTFTR